MRAWVLDRRLSVDTMQGLMHRASWDLRTRWPVEQRPVPARSAGCSSTSGRTVTLAGPTATTPRLGSGGDRPPPPGCRGHHPFALGLGEGNPAVGAQGRQAWASQRRRRVLPSAVGPPQGPAGPWCRARRGPVGVGRSRGRPPRPGRSGQVSRSVSTARSGTSDRSAARCHDASSQVRPADSPPAGRFEYRRSGSEQCAHLLSEDDLDEPAARFVPCGLMGTPRQ